MGNFQNPYDDPDRIWMRERFVPLLKSTFEEPSSRHEIVESFTIRNRYLYVVCEFDAETMNGGIDQYLWNPSGDYFEICLDAFRAIHAPRAEKFLIAALDCLGQAGRTMNTLERRKVFDEVVKKSGMIRKNVPHDVEPDVCGRLREYYEGKEVV